MIGVPRGEIKLSIAAEQPVPHVTKQEHILGRLGRGRHFPSQHSPIGRINEHADPVGTRAGPLDEGGSQTCDGVRDGRQIR